MSQLHRSKKDILLDLFEESQKFFLQICRPIVWKLNLTSQDFVRISKRKIFGVFDLGHNIYMTLKETLKADLTQSIKDQNSVVSGTLRMALTAITNEEVSGKEAKELSDNEVLVVLTKEAKKRKESVEAYLQANRKDLADKERNFYNPKETDVLNIVQKAAKIGQRKLGIEQAQNKLASGDYDSETPSKVTMKATYKPKKKSNVSAKAMKELNPDYQIELYDDKRCLDFLDKHYGKKYCDIFDHLIS